MPRKPGKSPLLSRVLRWLGIAVLAFIALSTALVLPFRWINPPTSAFMLQDQSGLEPVLYEWQDWHSIGLAPTLAVVASEDQKFAQHHGFDLQSIGNAIETFADGGSLRGASTISQQVAKNMYLWPGRSFVRKGLEAWFTLLIEASWSKQRIIEVYLNIAEFGPGVYGVPAASRYFFAREPENLSDAQAALLAAVLPNPNQLMVAQPSGYVRDRQRWTLNHMGRLRRERWIALLK